MLDDTKSFPAEVVEALAQAYRIAAHGGGARPEWAELQAAGQERYRSLARSQLRELRRQGLSVELVQIAEAA